MSGFNISGVTGLSDGVGLIRGRSSLFSGAYLDLYFGLSYYGLDEVPYTALTSLPGFTFTRASLATMFDATGELVYGPNNQLLQSQTFATSWAATAATVSSDVTTAPDGSSTADKLVETAATSQHLLGQGSTQGGAAAVLSCYAKADERTWVALAITDAGGSNRITYFNLATGVVGTTGTGITASITSAGNGWYRCAVYLPATFNGTYTHRIYLASADNTNNYAGDGTSGLYIWGAQAEAVTYVTTPGAYNATTSSPYFGPRLTYDPVTLASLGILVEEARTNIALWNRDLTNAVWVKVNTTAAKTEVGIDGVANSASLITATAPAATTLQTIVLSSSTRQQSAWVKRVTGTGVVNMTTDGVTWTAVAVTADWTRVTIPAQAAVVNPVLGFQIMTSGDAIAVDFVQNETGTGATSSIPTTTAATTRAADIAYVANLDTLPAFTVVAEGIPSMPVGYGVVQTLAGYDDGTASNRVYVFRDATGSSALQFASSTGWSVLAANWAQGATGKAAFTSIQGRQAGSFNAGVVLTGTSNQPANLSSLSIGVRSDRATSVFNGTISRIRIYNTALTDAQLQALTT
jgi:hypothetical protein